MEATVTKILCVYRYCVQTVYLVNLAVCELTD